MERSDVSLTIIKRRQPVWVATTGDDGNSGLDSTHPLKTITAALQRLECHRILVQNGIYREQVTINRPVEIVNALSYGGSFGPEDEDYLAHMADIRGCSYVSPWTVDDGPSHSWVASYSGTARGVYSAGVQDADGLWSKLTKRSSIAEVRANPGSYYQAGLANSVYVHMPDDSDPNDGQIEIAAREFCLVIGANCTELLVQGVACTAAQTRGVNAYKSFGFEGGDYTFEDCVFRYCATDDTEAGFGFATSGYLRTRLRACRAYGNLWDGFNFHHGGYHALESCHAWRNGDDGASPHEDAYLVVDGGHYYGNGKAGLIAVLGATMDVYGARLTDNAQGIQYTDAGTRGRVERSLIADNTYGLRIHSGAQVTTFQNTIRGNTTDRLIDSGGAEYEVSSWPTL